MFNPHVQSGFSLLKPLKKTQGLTLDVMLNERNLIYFQTQQNADRHTIDRHTI